MATYYKEKYTMVDYVTNTAFVNEKKTINNGFITKAKATLTKLEALNKRIQDGEANISSSTIKNEIIAIRDEFGDSLRVSNYKEVARRQPTRIAIDDHLLQYLRYGQEGQGKKYTGQDGDTYFTARSRIMHAAAQSGFANLNTNTRAEDLNIATEMIKDFIIPGLEKAFGSDKYGVSKVFQTDNYDLGPFKSFTVLYFPSMDSVDDFCGFEVKTNYQVADGQLYGRDNAVKNYIKKVQQAFTAQSMPISYKSAYHFVVEIVNKNDLAVGCVGVGSPGTLETAPRNVLFYTKSNNSILSDATATNEEKTDYVAKTFMRVNEGDNKTLAVNPEGVDASLTKFAIPQPGVIDPNNLATALAQLNTFDLPEPTKEEVNEDQIKRDAEDQTARKEAGFGRTSIDGTVIDKYEYDENLLIVGIANCQLFEIDSEGVETNIGSSSLDGTIKIEEFGVKSKLRIVPEFFYREKTFEFNNNEPNDIDSLFELELGSDIDGEIIIKPKEEFIEPDVVEEVDTEPRRCGGTVINSLTSEPVAGIPVIYGLGARRISTTTNDAGEFILTIPEPKLDIDKHFQQVTERIRAAQQKGLDFQKLFESGSFAINSTLANGGAQGTEIVNNLAGNFLQNSDQVSQFSSNLLIGNPASLNQLQVPGILASNPRITDLNNGVEGLNLFSTRVAEEGGAIGLFGKGINELNRLSFEGGVWTQDKLNYLVDPLNSQTFRDIENFKNRLQTLTAKLPGRKIIIKGSGISNQGENNPAQEIKYRTKRITPFDADQNVIPDLNIIRLTPRTIGIRNSLRKVKYKDQFGDPSDKINKFREKIRDFNLFSAIKRQGIIQELKRQLIPTLINSIGVPLGMYYLDDILQENKADAEEAILNNDIFCLSEAQMRSLVRKLNFLNSTLTKTYTAINTASTAVKSGNRLIQVIQTSIEVYQFVPFIYSAVPAPDTITKINSDGIQKAKTQLEKAKYINDNIVSWMMDVSSYLSKAVDIIKILQKVMEKCLREIQQTTTSKPEEDIVIDPIAADLQEINEFINTQVNLLGDTQFFDINGFKLEIESDIVDDFSIPRKRAIAKDTNGVIVLKGEYSYTADPQILIEELKFYIETNELKAF